MSLAMAVMYAQGVQLYIVPTADSRETWQSTIRHIAMEGICILPGIMQDLMYLS